MKKYCWMCGSKLEEVESRNYDEHTGEKILEMVCVKVGCKKSCDFFGHEFKRYAWWHTDVECVKCGYRPPDY